MKNTVLLIEANPAIQTMASLTLNTQGVEVIVAATTALASKALLEHQPEIVICSTDIEKVDPLKLCKKCKSELNSAFILLAAKGETTTLAQKAQKAGVDNILAKPFNSQQLAAVVGKVLEQIRNPDATEVLLIISDPLLREVLNRIIKKRGGKPSICATTYEALIAVEKISFGATISESDTCSDLSWYKAKKMGQLIAVKDKDEDIFETDKFSLIERPLSVEKIDEIFETHIPNLQAKNESTDVCLDPGEQALLAARISAAVYETLLHQIDLRNGNWIKAADATRDQVSKICYDFQRLITG